jgi:hypothetical protein
MQSYWTIREPSCQWHTLENLCDAVMDVFQNWALLGLSCVDLLGLVLAGIGLMD